MIKGELETIERYLQELEALRYYPRVKAERDALAPEVAQLEAQLEREVASGKELSRRLRKREAEVKELGGRLTEAEGQLSPLREFKVKLADGGGLTLEEMKDLFIRMQEGEIEGRVKNRLIEMEGDMLSRMPALVHKELVRVLKGRRWSPEIEKAVSSRASQMANEMLRDRGKWPGWFKDCYLQQVKEAVAKGVNSEFEGRVQGEAQKRLDAVRAGQWEKYTAAKARELATDLRGMVSQLEGTWWFACDRCGRRLALDLGPQEIGELLAGGMVDVACSTCTDPAPFPLILSTGPHKVGSLTLGGLLRLYIGKAPTS